MKLHYLILWGFFSLGLSCFASTPQKSPPVQKLPLVIDHTNLFELENSSLSLNLNLCVEAFQLNQIWQNLPTYKERNDLKEKLNLVFDAMRKQCEKYHPSHNEELSTQEKQLYILETEVRIYMYSIYKLIKDKVSVTFIEESLTNISV